MDAYFEGYFVFRRALRSDGKLSELCVTRLARELTYLYGHGRKHSVSFDEFMHGRTKAGLQEASQEKLLQLLTFLPVCTSRTTTVNEPVGLFCRRRSAREMRRKGQWPWDWTEDYLAGYKHMSKSEFDTNMGLSRNIKGATFRQTWRILGQSAIAKRRSIPHQTVFIVFHQLDTCFNDYLTGKIASERILRIQKREDPGIVRFIEGLKFVKLLHTRIDGVYPGLCDA